LRLRRIIPFENRQFFKPRIDLTEMRPLGRVFCLWSVVGVWRYLEWARH